MKIVANKWEFARIIRRCMEYGDCDHCIFSEWCGSEKGKSIEDFAEINIEVQEDDR